MKKKIIAILIILLLMTQSVLVLGKEKSSVLKIYIPRQAQVRNDIVTLGDICAIKGEQELVNKANSIIVGKFSMPFQTIGLSRSMILGRLASKGFVKNELKVTGAEKIAITRQSTIIKAKTIIDAAKTFMKDNVPSDSVNMLKQIGTVKDVELPAHVGQVELVASLGQSDTSAKVKINVAVMSGGYKISEQQVEFRLGYISKQIVATKNIKRGEVLSSENITITEEVKNKEQSQKLQQPYGLVARRAIHNGNVITDSMVDTAEKKVIIKRNSNVAVTIKKDGLFMQAIGKSLEEGRIGDYIKVRMQISNLSRVIYAQIKPDGTVEPLM
jgi:flagella basal body P-ring formation protein FlgA